MTTDATIDEGTSTTKKKPGRKPKASAPEGDAIPIRSTVGGIQHRLVRCVGISPLLMNRMSDEQLEAIRSKKKAGKMAEKPSPHDECIHAEIEHVEAAQQRLCAELSALNTRLPVLRAMLTAETDGEQ